METLSVADRLDAWLRLYEEQLEHARHHENMRSQAMNVVIGISAALLAFLASGDRTPVEQAHASLFVGAFIVVTNFYGLLMSLKHYERALLCVEKAASYRLVVSEWISTETHNFEKIRQAVHDRHPQVLPIKIYAHYLWSGLHLIIVIIGAAVLLNGICS